MRVLLDTNILLRLSERTHPHHPAAREAIRVLATAGTTFCIGSQTISEFLAVATRSIGDRGLGMDPTLADAELSKVTSALDMLYDSAAVMTELRRLVVAYTVIGKSVHDTKLVASMLASGVTDILTFNGGDFVRFSSLVRVLDPATVASNPPAQAP
jgi:predicted nucleic acid-binding protein